MEAWARAAILSAITIWLLAFMFLAGLIFGFYSPDLGRGGFSVQAFLGLATGISFLSFLGSAVGFHFGTRSGRMPGKVRKPDGRCSLFARQLSCSRRTGPVKSMEDTRLQWNWIEFDFAPASSRATLNCEASFNKRTDLFESGTEGTPKVETTTFEIPLEGYKGHIAVPRSLCTSRRSRGRWTVQVACSQDAQEPPKGSLHC